MEFVKDFLIYEAGALCGFFIAALMNAARWTGNHHQI